MRSLAAVVFILFGLALQSTLFAYLEPLRPVIAIPFVLYVSLSQSVRWGSFLAFLLGYAEDLFMGTPPGLRAFCLTTLYLGTRPMHDKIRVEGIGPLLFLGFIGSVWVSFMDTFLRRIFIASFSIGGAYLGSLLLASIATGVATPVFVWLLRAITKAPLGNERESLLLK